MEYDPIITFLTDRSVPEQTVVLLLLLPVVVTSTSFFRQVIGIKAFGIYTPSIITFALLAFGPNGLKYGVVIFGIVIFIGMVTRYILRRFRLLYLPRVAITLSVISFSMLGILVIGGSFNRTGLAGVSIFPLLIMITITEKFVAVQIEKGTKAALILAIETLVISMAGYALLSWGSFVSFILAYPWTILFTFPINIILGKWTGLRFSEYVRFSRILRQK